MIELVDQQDFMSPFVQCQNLDIKGRQAICQKKGRQAY